MANGYINIPGLESGGGGVGSLNGLVGALNLVAGAGITVTPAGANITIASTGSADPLAIYRNNAQPPTQDISWAGQTIFHLGAIISATANPASAGFVRLGNTDSINWRNQANNADHGITLDNSDILQFVGANYYNFDNAVLATRFQTESLVPASSGFLRFGKSEQIAWRNSTNTGDVTMSNGNAGHDFILSDNTDPLLNFVMGGTITIDNGTPRATAGDLRLSNGMSIDWRNITNNGEVSLSYNGDFHLANSIGGNVNLIMQGNNGYLSIGDASPAQSGNLRLPYGTAIAWRNSGDTADLSFGSSSGNRLVLSLGGSPLAAQLDVDGNIFAEGYLMAGNGIFGANPASGAVRLLNNTSVMWRNAANTADRGLVLNASDQFDLGFGSQLNVQTVNSQTFQSSQGTPASVGRIKLSNNDRLSWANHNASGDIYWIVDSTDHMRLQNASLDLSNSLYQLPTASAATNGFINLQNNANISWRNFANSADFGIKIDANDAMVLSATGVVFPNTTSGAVVTPETGMVIFDTGVSKLKVWTGAAWETITSI